jgi:hypothetical protein
MASCTAYTASCVVGPAVTCGMLLCCNGWLPADSPQPAAGCTLEPALMATFNPAQHSHHLSSLRAQLAGPGRATSPIESFSFGNKQEDEVSASVYAVRSLRLLCIVSLCALLLLFCALPSVLIDRVA